MPLSAKARIEVYLPDVVEAAYAELLPAFQQEFTYAFGGCTLVRDLEGSYLARRGFVMRDRINLLYCDTPFDFERHFVTLSEYADELRDATMRALAEEAVLIAVFSVYHAR